ncbi:MAG: hypothetical protein JEZ12_13845 [Desulfobacterium sp.]|nr:hypothetical protein [Desulfobacterium sp.]
MEHNTNKTDNRERPLWEQRAMAFVTRSFRQLWGKNNEEMLAWLFNQGLSNPFVRTQLWGWNKHGQARNPALWGIEPTDDTPALVLPQGIVVPYIVDKRLRKITIVNNETMEVPGGSHEPMVLGNQFKVIALVPDCVDGLFLFQEKGEQLGVIIPCGPAAKEPLDAAAEKMLSNACTVLVFYKDSDRELPPPGQREIKYSGQTVALRYGHTRELPGLCDPFIKA